jgi:hypothetical protein
VFKVIHDGGGAELRFEHPLAAISHAIMQSMASTSVARVIVKDNLVCVARSGRLFAGVDARREITPAEAVRTAERLIGRE